ncbi:MAG: hypothetical protein WD342_04750 [Verrucomicrobiales bacterium]
MKSLLRLRPALSPLAAACCLLSISPDVRGNEEIGFIESFALADDRAKAVAELIPGTEDYYFFKALLAQQERRLEDAEDLLEPWIKRHGETPRVVEIRNRQALLSYTNAPADTLAYLKDRLGLAFDHQRRKLDEKPDFPTRLNEEQADWEAFRSEALARPDLGGVSDAGLDRLVRDQVVLNATQRRELLRRLKFPDYERLVGLIAADLRTRESQGFGEFDIHRRLTLAQLDELAGLRPELDNDPRFVEAKVLKLRPGDDVSWRRDPEALAAYLDRLWDYVETLPETFSGMQAAVLYRRLELARSRGDYPQELFLSYLRLPRPMPYMAPEYLQSQQQRGNRADLDADFSPTVGFPPVRNDEPLVRDYLEHYFVDDETFERFSPYVRETYLRRVFAETKLLNGIGDPERWYSLLTPAQVQNLKDRVEIEFSPTNKERFTAGDAVSLAVGLKNVTELAVKVYEINALNFYLEKKQEINTDLNLDGLVPNEEKIYRYEDEPMRRRTEVFSLEALEGERGIWVVELVGNGISSRSLVRKGKLQHLSRSTAAGELLTVLDDANNPVESPSAWFGGKSYEADEDGRILLPFSTSGTVPVVLTDGDFASFAQVELPAEDYALEAGIMLNQETLLPGSEARVAVRPALSLNGEPVPARLLENARLTVSTMDADGIASATDREDFPLFDDRESIHAFRVPDRLREVTVTLTADIPSISNPGEPIECRSSRTFQVNGVSSEDAVADAYLGRRDGDYFIEVLGRTGEPIEDTAVTVTLRHRDFSKPLRFSLKTDAAGRVDLGALEGIEHVTCADGARVARAWDLEGDRHSQPSTLHSRTGEVVTIPNLGAGGALDRGDFAIFETRSDVLVSDAFEKAELDGDAVKLEGLEPGNYLVVLRSVGKTIDLRVTESEKQAFGYALSEHRHLELRNEEPLHIASLAKQGEGIRIALANAGELTRVHLVATRYLPEYDPFRSLDRDDLASPFQIRRGGNESRYVSGRDIGEEYRYILERRNADKFPGNMLTRPGLILNPWELNETETDIEDARAGEALTRSRDMDEGGRESAPAAPGGAERRSELAQRVRDLSFLGNQALFLPNLEVGEDGTISVDAADLGDRQHLHVLAVDGTSTDYRQMSLPAPEGGVEKRDLRLKETLELGKHFTQRRDVTLLKEGQTLTIGDLRSSELESYDTLGGVYGTLLGINPDENLSEFNFLSEWVDLDEEKKRSLYSKYASHELNFFLSRKDEDFFDTVVKPYLANKKDKTFLDEYLVGRPLDRYLEPWEFGRLNIVERILLGRRLGEAEQRRTADHVGSLHELLPPDPEQEAMWFRQALRGRRSDSDSARWGFDRAPRSVEMALEEGIDPADGADAFAAPAARMATIASKSTTEAASPEVRQKLGMEAEAGDRLSSVVPRVVGGAEYAKVEELRERAKTQALFRKLESTKEWAENNYYHLPIQDQNAELVTVNAFWKDFADWNGEGGFYSREFPAATRNFTEMMFVLAILDLPFSAEEHEIAVDENELKLTANSAVVVFHEEIQETSLSEDETPILVSQNFFRHDDRHRFVDGQQVDKFVTDEFLAGVVYGSQVVVTNPTSSAHRLDLLVQIPEGSVPVSGSDYTRSRPVQLGPFSTERIETRFYFPEPSGDETFAVYPVRVSKNEEVIAVGEEAEFKVVEQLTRFDEASWEYLSQYGSEKEVLDYLENNNLHRLELGLIAWRAREDVDFFRRVTVVIASRHAYDDTLWSYGIHHDVTPAIREYLKHREDFLGQCGRWIDCELVSLDPIDRHWYQHLEYSPLVNARTHRLGRERSILNDRFREQYDAFLWLTAYKPEPNAGNRLAVATYLFLQDRVAEGLEWLESVDADRLDAKLQYDYLVAYAALYRGDADKAKQVAANHLDHPVDRWREKFARVDARVNEIQGAEAEAGDEETREGQMENLGAREPSLELTATGRRAELDYRNVEAVTVNYYEMDLEFLFSSKPFVSGESGQFGFIKPNRTERKELPADGHTLEFTVPDEFASKNVLVEVVGGGRTDSVAVYSNRLEVRISGNYGRLQVLHEEEREPLASVYVKVYARMKSGDVRFFKDGYTDLRGKFDYVSLNTDELDDVDELSLLVMSDEHGSLVREVDPPQR